jgi:alpha-beta hydrolase superfamily lysophospholipase
VATARFFTQVITAQARAVERAGEVKLPLLVMYAGDDQIADPERSRVFFERAASADKTIHGYDGYYHEIFNETNKEVVFKDWERWLAGRV